MLSDRDMMLIDYSSLLERESAINILINITANFLSLAIPQDRIRCAVDAVLTSPVTRRKPALGSVSIAEAYKSDAFICALWKIFGTHAKKYGYKPIRDVKCLS